MIRVVAALVERDGRILACRRRADADHGGRWEFPGGKIEPGESPADALRRELREELDVEAEIGPVVWRTRHRYPGREPVHLTFFRVAAFRGTLRNRTFAEVRWLDPRRLGELDFLEADRALVSRLAASADRDDPAAPARPVRQSGGRPLPNPARGRGPTGRT